MGFALGGDDSFGSGGLGRKTSPLLVPCVSGKVEVSGPFQPNTNFSASSKK